jgi:hypothetical protein
MNDRGAGCEEFRCVPEEGSSVFFRYTVTCLTDYTASQHRRGHNMYIHCIYQNILSHIRETLDGSFGLKIGFVDHLQVVTTNNYNTNPNFHTLQITTAHAKSPQSASTTRFPIRCLHNGDSPTAPTESSLLRLPYD